MSNTQFTPGSQVLSLHGVADEIALYTCCSCGLNYRSIIRLGQSVLCRSCSHERCPRCATWGNGEQDSDSVYGAEQEEASASTATEIRRPANARFPQRRSTTSNTPQSPLLNDFGFRSVTGPPGSPYIGSPSRSRDDLFRTGKRTASGRIHNPAGPSSMLMRGSSFRQPQMDNPQMLPGSRSRAYSLEGGMCGTPSQMGTPASLSGDSFSSTPYLSGASGSPWEDSLYGTPQLPEFENFNLGDSASAAINVLPPAGPPATKRKVQDHADCPVRLEEVLRKKPKKRRMTQPQQKVWVEDPEDQKLLDRKRNTMHARNSRQNRTTYMEGLEIYQQWATPKIQKLEQELEAKNEEVARLRRENAALKPTTMAPPPVPRDIASEFGTPQPSFEGDWPVMDSSQKPTPPDADEPDKMSFFPALEDQRLSVPPNARSFVSLPPLATPHPISTTTGPPIPDPDTAALNEQALLRALDEGDLILSQFDAHSTTPTEPPSNNPWFYSDQPVPAPSSAEILPRDHDVFEFEDPSLANLDPTLLANFDWPDLGLNVNNGEDDGGHAQDDTSRM